MQQNFGDLTCSHLGNADFDWRQSRASRTFAREFDRGHVCALLGFAEIKNRSRREDDEEMGKEEEMYRSAKRRRLVTNGTTVLRHSRRLRKRKDVSGRERNDNFVSLVHLSPMVSFAFDEEISAGYVTSAATRSAGFPGAQSRLLARSKIIISLVPTTDNANR